MRTTDLEEMNVKFGDCSQCQLNTAWYFPDYRFPEWEWGFVHRYCIECKRTYYVEHREEICQAYQVWLDWNHPTPGYVYGLFDPRDRTLRYIGRSHDLAKRIREHRNTSSKEKTTRAAWILELHEQGLTFEYGILAMATPGYFVVEMEARWICHALQHRYPITNREAEEGYFNDKRFNAIRSSSQDFFTCPDHKLPCGDLNRMRIIKDYARWTKTMPAELPLSGWFQEWD